MRFRFPAIAIVAFAASCSGAAPKGSGRLVTVVTIDWEGAFIKPVSLDALDDLRTALGGAVPLTHFVCPAYFAKDKPSTIVAPALHEAVRDGDELAPHLHAWRSLAQAAGVAPRLAPSFRSGTDKLMEFEDGDAGFDVDLDAYDVPELRALLRTSVKLLAGSGLPVTTSFRAGGYLTTPKMQLALVDEGFTIDSSATDYRPLVGQAGHLPDRIAEVWPDVDSTAQPRVLATTDGELVELPIAATADYVGADAMRAAFDSAGARLTREPDRDVFVVLAMHQETAELFGPRVGDAIAYVRGKKELAPRLVFATVQAAAELARGGR